MSTDKTLIITVGLPRSGKSTWSLAQNCPVVNPDAIRLAIHGQRFNAQAEPFVWLVAKTMVRSLFLAGHNTVIVDATNTTRKRRGEWQASEWETRFKVISAQKETCIERAVAEGDNEIVPVIERMALQFEPLGAGEREWR